MDVNQINQPRADVQEADRAKTSGVRARRSGETGVAEKTGRTAPAADTVSVSDQNFFYKAAMKATGANQFLDWSGERSPFAYRSGIEVQSKDEVLKTLQLLWDAKEYAPEHWNLKKAVKDLRARMADVKEQDNQYRAYYDEHKPAARPPHAEAQEANSAKTSVAQAQRSSESGAVEKAGAAAPAVASGPEQDVFYTSVMKSTGADQFLDWSDMRSTHVYGHGVEARSKDEVLQNLQALLDSKEETPEHWNVKEVVEDLQARMVGVREGDNQYRQYYDLMTGAPTAKLFSMSTDILGATEEGRAEAEELYHEFLAKDAGRASAQDDLFSMRLSIPGYALPVPEKYGVVRTAEKTLAQHAYIEENFGAENRREDAARAKDGADGVSRADAYMRMLERAVNRPQAFWDHQKEFAIRTAEYSNDAAKARGEKHLSPQEMQEKLRRMGGDRRASYQASLDSFKKAVAGEELQKSITALISRRAENKP